MMVKETTRQQFEQSVVPRLRALGRRLRLYVLLDGLAVLLPAVIFVILVTLLVDRSMRLDQNMRVTQLLTTLAGLLFVAWRWVWRPLRVPVGDEDLALLVERRFPQLASRLISAVEFTRRGERSPARSTEMMDAAVREASGQVSGVSFQDALAHARARKQAGVAFGCVALMTLIVIGARPTMALWFDRNVLLRDVEWPQRNKLAVTGLKDGKMLVPRGDDVSLSAEVVPGYEAPRQVFIEYRGSESGVSERKQMPAVVSQGTGGGRRGTPSFTHTFERIEETLECRVSGGDARTGWFTVDVVDRPRIDDVIIAVGPPAYTKIERYELRPGQTVAEALKGSRLEFRVKTNKPVVKAMLVRDLGGGRQELGSAEGLGGRELTAGDAPPATASYQFQMEDELGFSNISDRSPPLRLSVRLVADKPPGVKMRVKGVGEMITSEAILPIEVDFSDSFGLATAGLVYDPGRKDFKSVTEPIEGFESGAKAFAHTVDWSAAKHKLAEGDRLSLRAESQDFDDVSGPNVGQSSTVVLRVVSREELLAELNRREQEYRQDFERLIRSQEELYSEFLSASRPPSAAEPTRDRVRMFGQLARRQRDHAGRMNSIRMQFEQVLSELQVNQLSSPTVETRLGGGIIQPMGSVSRTRMPAAADGLDGLGREESAQALQSAKDAQAAILAEMNRILANMQKWEGFQEAVALLREVLKMQGNLSQEIEKRIEEEVFGGGLGTQPAGGRLSE